MAADNHSAQVILDVTANKRVITRERKWLKSYHPKFKMSDLLKHPRAEVIKHTTGPLQTVYRTELPTGETVIIKILNLEGAGSYIFEAVIHEAFIGLRGLNDLNLPCFARVLDLNIEPHGGSVMYQDAGNISLYDYIPTASPTDLQQLVCELITGLHCAYTQLDFTHYDLHLGNIMVREGHPIIIDYGWSHIKKSKTHYGVMMRSGAIYDRSMWYHDIVKILMTILSECTVELVMVANQSELSTQYEEQLGHKSTLEQDMALELLCRGRPTRKLTLELRHTNSELKRIQRQFRANNILPRPYKLAGWFQTLLQFFDPSAPFDAPYIQKYQATYPYCQPSVEMISQGYDFDQFMIYLEAHTS